MCAQAGVRDFTFDACDLELLFANKCATSLPGDGKTEYRVCYLTCATVAWLLGKCSAGVIQESAKSCASLVDSYFLQSDDLSELIVFYTISC